MNSEARYGKRLPQSSAQQPGIRTWRQVMRKVKAGAVTRHRSIEFSAVEQGAKSATIIAGIAKKAGIIAARKARANGLPRVTYKDGKLIRIARDVTKLVAGHDNISTGRDAYFSKVKVGQVYARAK